MDKIKTREDVYEAAEEIGSQSDKVLSSFNASIQEIMYAQGWALGDVELYLASGLLPRIVQRTLALYYELYLHFEKLIVQDPNPDQFKEFTMLHIKYHARQLQQIRMYATRRSALILRAYTYLRDAKKDDFTNMKLVGAITLKLQELTRSLTDQGSADMSHNKVKDWACTHCHSEIHEGGAGACPLKDVTAKPC
jgi:hypothetical protein